ncbi:MAG: dihydropyrimidinase [Vicinamibacterales bacterium]
MTAPFDLVVRGGTVVTDTGARRLDVGVRAGRIAALGERLGPAAQEVDASGRLVMPGGVDAHCHIDQRSSSGLMTADDFFTGGVSAACGGTTTIVPFAAQHRGQRLREVVADYHGRAEGRAFVDYGFHLIVSDPTAAALEEDLPGLVAQGCPSLKVYMTYDALKLTDRQLLDVFTAAASLGAIVLVHAENSDAVAWQTARLLAAGHTEPRHHAASRPPLAEGEATERAIALAQLAGAAVFIVHASCREALAAIVRAKAQGRRVWAETCPQYLLLSAADMDRPGFEAARFICSPPLRSAADQAALWEALASGTLDLVASDHAPYRLHDANGKMVHGADAPFTRIPSGMPGLELRMPLLFSEGVVKGRLTLSRFVALTSSNPARVYGMFPRKGAIEVGSDADLVVWDADREAVVSQAALHDAMDDTPFEGIRVTGWPSCTMSRGEIVWDGQSVRGGPGRGRFVARLPLAT